MALTYNHVPRFISAPPDFWSSLGQFPTKIMDQNFGQELCPRDLKEPFVPGDFALPRSAECIDGSGFSSVAIAPDDFFQIQLSSGQFKVEDLKVKFRRDSVIIAGEHSYLKEGDGMTYRSFERKYLLPVHAQVGDQSCVSRDGGVLTVKIPMVAKSLEK